MFWKDRYHEDMEKRLVSKKDLIQVWQKNRKCSTDF